LANSEGKRNDAVGLGPPLTPALSRRERGKLDRRSQLPFFAVVLEGWEVVPAVRANDRVEEEVGRQREANVHEWERG